MKQKQRILKFVFANILLMVALSASARAGDVPSGKIWQGFYGGLALGGAYNTANPGTELITSGYFLAGDSSQVDPLLQEDLESADITGSALLGYDYQSGNLTYGIEADLTLMDYSETSRFGPTAYDTNGVIFETDTTVETKFMFSLRPKLGYVMDDFHFYVSAGPTLSSIKTTFHYEDAEATTTDINHVNRKLAFGVSSSVGAGYHLGEGWSVRGDYVFNYFPDTDDGTSRFNNDASDDFKFDGEFLSHNIRIALIKRF